MFSLYLCGLGQSLVREQAPTPEALAQKIEALMAKIRHNCVHASHWVICSVCVRIALTEQAQESAADRVRLGLVAEKLKDEIDNRQAEAATTLLTHIYQEDWDYFAARPTLMDAIGAHVRLAFVVEQARAIERATWEKIADTLDALHVGLALIQGFVNTAEPPFAEQRRVLEIVAKNLLAVDRARAAQGGTNG